jgi:hypothetical protein
LGHPRCKYITCPFCTVTNSNFLQDSNKVQQSFSSENEACLWQALPFIEELLAKWEKKRDGIRGYEQFSIYKMAIQDGVNKLRKYYCKFDEKLVYILALSKPISQVSLYSVLNVSL